jgi:starch synthase
MNNKINVFHVASEVSPFSKTGGLGDVSCSLPKALFALGHKVSIITPLYGKLIDKDKYNLKLIYKNINVIVDSNNRFKVNFWKGELVKGLPVYFVDYKDYFSKFKKIYISEKDSVRFALFNFAALKLIKILDDKPEIIHCHDWHTGLIPYLLKNNPRYIKKLGHIKTVFTIHNLVFQMGRPWFKVSLEGKDYGRKKLPVLNDSDFLNINFAKRAIMSADIINTVSEKYREEVMTKKFGQDLHRILKNRKDRLFGIVNGIDYNSYNPAQDKGLFKNYSFYDFSLKEENKKFLQKKLNFLVNKNLPLFCFTSRITHQKGFDIIIDLLPHLLKLDIQIVFMGDGENSYIKKLKKMQSKYPRKIRWMPFDQSKETLLYAASDFFILPSNYEPCGINQMISMRYGAVPIVRDIGGLYDTVSNFNPNNNKGTGFTFKSPDVFSLFWAIVRALENYKYKNVWDNLVVRVMRKSSSWEIPAQKYIELYRKSIKIKN